jgi:hypothetical protein
MKDLRATRSPALDAPEVVSLKNSYQSAFSHYLAGFVYEALGEKDLAAPATARLPSCARTRHCWSRPCCTWTKPRSAPMKRCPDRGAERPGTSPRFDSHAAAHADRWQSGDHPAVVPGHQGRHIDRTDAQIGVDGQQQPDATQQHQRHVPPALRDDMPGIILRTTVRAVTVAWRRRT